jgi:hypothetical protein
MHEGGWVTAGQEREERCVFTFGTIGGTGVDDRVTIHHPQHGFNHARNGLFFVFQNHHDGQQGTVGQFLGVGAQVAHLGLGTLQHVPKRRRGWTGGITLMKGFHGFARGVFFQMVQQF